MPNKMLIDSSHPEETRVVVTRGNRIEEFDFESASRKPLRGNIYLAKVTRVEPSLQAAFVDYGGNRHGFLAFAEIHPDYYQIPVADRQALIDEDARAEREAARREDNGRRRKHAAPAARRSEAPEVKSAPAEEPADTATATPEDGASAALADESATSEAPAVAAAPPGEGSPAEPAEAAPTAEPHAAPRAKRTESPDADDDEEEDGETDGEDAVEQLGGGDAMEELPERPRASRRQYKIQEVIKRRQILLVQVVKEERGTKGAALTTYLSLAGRYSVLMPNTARGGGISRKITNAVDRKRLKTVAQELEVPEGMGIILRTAGAARTKAEIKRDFEYLLRVWESVRELTLQSSAPALVYEEGSLVKRAIRDLYSKEIEEILVAGDDGYREAKDFMRMLAPSHARQVKAYKEGAPLFARFGVEAQLDAMFSNQVTLKSGGYLVINPTEALVSIDVNSGRSTREHNIEDTALKTNLEAAEEVARQLRLRDLAGLIVIDFIDMEEKRNNRSVERKLKDCLKNDRARIQIGRISAFGLLEMSRQRIRTGVVEGSSVVCPHCGGAGHVRSTPSVALHVLRMLEDQLIRSAAFNLSVRTRADVAFYILNQKRGHLADLERRFGVSIAVLADETLGAGRTFAIERGEAVLVPVVTPPPPAVTVAPAEEEPEEPAVEEEEVEEEAETEGEDGERPAAQADGDGRRKRRRRRRRGGRGEGRDGDEHPAPAAAAQEDRPAVSESPAGDDEEEGDDEAPDSAAAAEAGTDDEQARRRRRGRRGGRRNRRERDELPLEPRGETEAVSDEQPGAPAGLVIEEFALATAPAPALTANAPADEEPVSAIAVIAAEAAAFAEARPPEAQAGNGAAARIEATAEPPVAAEPAEIKEAPLPPRESIVSNPDAYRVNQADPAQPKRSGWWSKAKAAISGG